MALAEGEHLEPAVAGADRVGMLERAVQEAVAGTDGIPLAVAFDLKGEPVPEST